MTKSLTSLIEPLAQADVDLWTDHHRAIQALPGNPYGVEVLQFGGATGLLVQSIPVPYYNRMILTVDRSWELAQAVDFYRLRFMPFRIDVNPYGADQDLLDGLTEAGFQPVGLQTNLFARPVPLPGSCSRSIRVVEVAAREASSFAAMHDRAYYGEMHTPTRLVAFRRAALVARCGRPGWRFFAAYVDNQMAGGAGVFMRDGVATLASAATLPEFRSRGVQTALLNHRLAIAADEGCDLIAGRCNVGSPSQRNLERAGLATAYTKIVFQHSWPRSARPSRRKSTTILLDERAPVGIGS